MCSKSICSKLRPQDQKGERLVGEFVDRYFYGVSPRILEVERVSDPDLQIRGIDLQLCYKESPEDLKLVDEKAAIWYMNKDLRSFALELCFVNRGGELHAGWFVDPNKETDHYAFMWLKGNPRLQGVEDIEEVEWMLVGRKTLQDEVWNSVSKEVVREQASALLKDPERRSINLAPALPFYLTISRQLVEQPINLVFRKQRLMELALDYQIIKPI